MGGWSIMNSAEGDLLFRFSVQRRILACNIRALPGSFTFLFRRNFVIGNKGMDVLYSVRVAVSLAACIYFLNAKTKSLARAFIIGLGALATGWVCGSIFVPMIPSANTPKLDT